jgi:hypothetical protein
MVSVYLENPTKPITTLSQEISVISAKTNRKYGKD